MREKKDRFFQEKVRAASDPTPVKEGTPYKKFIIKDFEVYELTYDWKKKKWSAPKYVRKMNER